MSLPVEGKRARSTRQTKKPELFIPHQPKRKKQRPIRQVRVKAPSLIESDLEEESSDSEFEVESIRDRRVYRKKVQYLVKWRGYESDDNTWEPEAHLTDCKALDSFLASLKDQPGGDSEPLDSRTRPSFPDLYFSIHFLLLGLATKALAQQEQELFGDRIVIHREKVRKVMD